MTVFWVSNREMEVVAPSMVSSMSSMSSMKRSLSVVVTVTPGMTVSPGGLHPRHQSEAGHDGQGPHQAGHPVLGELVPGQHLEEGDVEQGPGGQPLQHPDDEDVLAGGRLHVGRHQDPDQDPDWGVDAEDDHVDEDSRLLDAAGDHIGSHAEHDRHGVDGDG